MSVWEVGDRALCVRGKHARTGAIYTVTKVTEPTEWKNGPTEVGLHFAEVFHPGRWNLHWQFYAGNFRKLYPHTPDEQDEITIRLMKGEKVEMI